MPTCFRSVSSRMYRWNTPSDDGMNSFVVTYATLTGSNAMIYLETDDPVESLKSW